MGPTSAEAVSDSLVMKGPRGLLQQAESGNSYRGSGISYVA